MRGLGVMISAVCFASCVSREPVGFPDAGPPPPPPSAQRGELRSVEPTRLIVSVTDGDNGPNVAARLQLYADGAPLRIGELDMYEIRQSRGYCELGAGAIGMWDGIALADGTADLLVGEAVCGAFSEIPFGRYTVRVWRGIEYEIFETDVDLRAGRGLVQLRAPLRRAFTPSGTLAADLHVHAQDSNDSLVPRRIRVITQAAAGIDVIGSTDHDFNGDFSEAIAELGMQDVITSIAGNELTARVGHFGLYPVTVDPTLPRNGAPATLDIENQTAQQLMTLMRSLPEQPFVQLNHPRLGAAALFDSAEWDGLSWPPPFPLDFDGIEVLAALTAFNEPSDARLSQSLRDFYTLVDNGVFVTALGNSDTHHLNWVLDGTSRTYVYVSETDVSQFSELELLAALRGRRAVATTGPWLDVSVEDARAGETAVATGPSVFVVIDLAQASWCRANRVRILRGGSVVEVLEVPDGATAFHWQGEISVAQDTWIGVDATGDEPLPVLVTGSYQQDHGRAGVSPAALINPILVDTADGVPLALPTKRPKTRDVSPPPGPYDLDP